MVLTGGMSPHRGKHMNSFIALLVILLSTAQTTPAQTPTANSDSINWATSFDEATRRAELEGKGIFLLQMFGRLDEELC
jgi:hypothetical protein